MHRNHHSEGGHYEEIHRWICVHFGLGSADKIQSVTIHWPSGKVETLSNLAADKFYSVLEGQGIVPFEAIRPSTPKK